MSDNPIELIVKDYIDGAGHREQQETRPYYPYMMPVQVDEIQLSKLHYLCQLLSAPRTDFSRRMFQAALDLAVDQYCQWSGKNQWHAHQEMQMVRRNLESQGYFEELRKRGYVTERDPSDED